MLSWQNRFSQQSKEEANTNNQVVCELLRTITIFCYTIQLFYWSIITLLIRIFFRGKVGPRLSWKRGNKLRMSITLSVAHEWVNEQTVICRLFPVVTYWSLYQSKPEFEPMFITLLRLGCTSLDYIHVWSPAQTDATFLDVTCCVRLHTMLHVGSWPAQSLKPVKLLATWKWTQQCYFLCTRLKNHSLHSPLL